VLVVVATAVQALVLHKIQQRADQGSVMVVVVLLIAETQAVVAVVVAISVAVVVVAMSPAWAVVVEAATSAVQASRVVLLLQEAVVPRATVPTLQGVQVETAERQVRVETVEDLLSR
jgi:hypothetical protein